MRYSGCPDLVGGRVGVAEAVLDLQPGVRPSIWKLDLDRPCPQDAKLARDGDFVKAESIAFMDEAIDGELKLFSVADRE